MGWQMIKITVDQKVYEALQKAFPKPANTAHRALAKYMSLLEAMLFYCLLAQSVRYGELLHSQVSPVDGPFGVHDF